ncbi:recombination regulator RecX [Corynebacterium pacaense]|uniref:recombination regulator RecX n=1 Tax=Corynebacterium pacaense TaxID=1816684 RepID=UPI001FE5D8B5|nr:recombination regulator RecX [Corynebacterium pacaense]
MQDIDRKLKKLREALVDFERQRSTAGSGGFFDHELEEKKAAVRKRALLLLDQRARSRQELRRRLLALEFEDAIIDLVLDDLANSRLLDDLNFASEWVRQRSSRRGKSTRALDRELQEKGVSAPTRERALAQIDPEDERGTARSVAVKKARSESRVPGDRADYDRALRRVVGVLARRGFPAGMSMDIAREALDERIEQLKH